MPAEVWLPKWMRNQVFIAIQAAGFDPIEFGLDDEGPDVRIHHRRSSAYFIIRQASGHYDGRSLVGDEPEWPFQAYSWSNVMERVSRWLGKVKDDVEEPDLWAELRRDTALLVGAGDDVTDNSPFTLDERELVAAHLQQVRDELQRTYSPLSAQMQELDKKVEYLIAASGRVGRADWRVMYVGVILTWIYATILPPENAKAAVHILITLLRTVGQLFGHDFPQLPGA
jgi:hypothetical protein